MRYIFFVAVMICSISVLSAQKYYTKVARIQFKSDAPLEKIEATNSNALVVLDGTNGRIECSVLIKGFQFEKALMQDHFNENYMESHLYPKGVFKGVISNMKDVKLTVDGSYKASINGELTMHGVTKTMLTTGLVTVKGGKITATTSFEILVADFKIEIPKVVKENVAEKVQISVSADLLPMP